LNAEEYPESWRVFNNLGDAYRADGNNESAKEAYEKSLRFNAQNSNAIEALKKLN
jgi:Tfp pilus assembly protein PilF